MRFDALIMSSIFPSSAPLGGGGGLFGGGGNALGGGLAPLGGAGAARDPKLGAPSPASLENYKLYIKVRRIRYCTFLYRELLT